jgi:hypothetical protein
MVGKLETGLEEIDGDFPRSRLLVRNNFRFVIFGPAARETL